MSKDSYMPDNVLPEVINDIHEVFTDGLQSAVLYGSAVTDQFVPGVSDINIMLILSESGLDSIPELARCFPAWSKKRVAPPLIVTLKELETSLDSFPLEYLNIISNYRVMEGINPLENIKIDPDHLRLQCERELRGKLIVLREAMISTGGKEPALKYTAVTSIKAISAIFRGVLYLLNEDSSNLTAPQVLIKAARRMNITDDIIFEEIWKLREEKKQPKGKILSIFKRYLKAVSESAAVVDAFIPKVK